MRILIVEDDRTLANGITRSLSQSGYAVDWTDTGIQADLSLARDVYDLVVLDIGLPGIDGFEVLQRLRQRKRYVPVLILTARDSIEDRVRGLDLGADDYLIKPFALREFNARIRALARRNQKDKKTKIVYGPLTIDTGQHRAWLDKNPVEFTPREWRVLEFLLLNVGRVISKDEIVETLCGWDEEITLNAVEVYVSRLRNKLEPAGVKIRTVRGFGYLIEETEHEEN
jgi:two-component system OmpR family response regulator